MSLLNAAAFVAIPFTFGGVFAHIMTFNAHRRLMALDCAYRKLDLGKKGKAWEPGRANHSRSRSRLASLAVKTGKVSASRA
jgi:hypothetical protein